MSEAEAGFFFHFFFLSTKRISFIIHCVCVLRHREAMGVVLHKDSKWYQQWKDFKDNNVVFNSKMILPAAASTLRWSKCCLMEQL